MLYALHSNTYYIRAKIFVKNACASLRTKRPHLSGYQAGNSPGTDSLPIIDGDFRVLKIAPRSEAHASGQLHPSVHLLVLSPDKRYVLVQARTANKDLSGNKLATSVSGHIKGETCLPGQIIGAETIEKTLSDEAFEEAGLIDLTFQFVAQFGYQSHLKADSSGSGAVYLNQEIASLYISRYSGMIMPNLSEVKWLGWFSLSGIMKLMQKQPALFAPSFVKDLEVYKKSEIFQKRCG